MAFKGKKDGTWSEASAVYGKVGGAWLYAKNVYGKKDGAWVAGWTDCRQHDAGGRDWTVADGVTVYQLTCGNRQSRIRTDYSKTGCTGYSRYTDWVAAPLCNGDCFTTSTGTVYSGTCANRTYVTRTYYTPVTGSSCTPYSTDSAPTASPNCDSTCFTGSAVDCDSCGSATLYTANAGSGCTTYTSGSCGSWGEAPNNDLNIGGVVYIWNGFFYLWQRYGICGSESGYYSITKCSVSESYRVTFEFCSGI